MGESELREEFMRRYPGFMCQEAEERARRPLPPLRCCGPSGVDLIATERHRQVSEEGWTPEHDTEHDACELAGAAIAYTAHAMYRRGVREIPNPFWPAGWDFNPSPDPIRNLVKAGALIAAEIDRLNQKRETEES